MIVSSALPEKLRSFHKVVADGSQIWYDFLMDPETIRPCTCGNLESDDSASMFIRLRCNGFPIVDVATCFLDPVRSRGRDGFRNGVMELESCEDFMAIGAEMDKLPFGNQATHGIPNTVIKMCPQCHTMNCLRNVTKFVLEDMGAEFDLQLTSGFGTTALFPKGNFCLGCGATRFPAVLPLDVVNYKDAASVRAVRDDEPPFR